jgi:hypothetical protein
MSDRASRWCVFLPCSREEVWAIPQSCLAEIVTVQTQSDVPPEQINWRGQDICVLDLDPGGKTPWRDPVGGQTGLIAVIPGLKGQGENWAVALRGEGLAVRNISTDKIRDLPDRVMERSSSAFELENSVYQVPDLPELQKQAGMYRALA